MNNNFNPKTKLLSNSNIQNSQNYTENQQYNLIKMQDEHLDEISTRLTSLNQVAKHIGNEVDEQNNIIQNIDNNVDIAQSGIDQSNRLINKINRITKCKCCNLCNWNIFVILLLIVIAIALLLVIIYS